MKPKYIFSAVFAVSILLAALLPSMGARRVKTVDAAGGPASSPAAAATLPPITLSGSALQPTTLPTLAPFHDSAPALTPTSLPDKSAPAQQSPAQPPPAPTLAPITTEQTIPGPSKAAAPAADVPQAALPGFQAFLSSFGGMPSGQVAGAYVEGLFALPVVQQPADNPDYVSPEDNILTQFVKPERFNVIGLLAHNYLSGKPFFQLQPGQEITVVYGGEHTARFRVTGFQHYQAVDSQDSNTDYIDLDDPQNPVLSQQQVFDRAYTTDGQLVLQTCIEKNGDYSWGRLFVVATPE